MPRTIESIVTNHRAAAALRRRGLPIWPYTVRIKDILAQDRSNESAAHCASVAAQIVSRFRGQLPVAWFDITHDDYDMTIDDIVEIMEDANLAYFDSLEPIDGRPIECLNGWLDEIYDWADRKRVWLG